MNYDISASMTRDDADALVRIRLIESYLDLQAIGFTADSKLSKSYRRVIKDFSSPSEWEEFKNNEENK